MAEKKHLKRINRGVKYWNEYIEDDWEGTPDLSGADLQGQSLNHIDLRHSNLSRANLSQAKLKNSIFIDTDLSGANISGAILTGADMSGANLSDANLSDANLAGANLNDANFKRCRLVNANLQKAKLNNACLDAAILIGADLSTANFSGVSINDANLSRWIIKDIECTHVIWQNKRIDFENPHDFEKSFAQIQSIIEILLDIPFSDLSYYTGRIIQQEINQKYGEGAVIFKGQTATSNDTTKFEFLSDPDKSTVINETLMELPGKLNPTIEDFKSNCEPKSIIGVKDEIDWQDIVFLKFPVFRPKELERALKERYARMHPLLQNIIRTIQLHIR